MRRAICAILSVFFFVYSVGSSHVTVAHPEAEPLWQRMGIPAGLFLLGCAVGGYAWKKLRVTSKVFLSVVGVITAANLIWTSMHILL